jgi:hypothetical protein
MGGNNSSSHPRATGGIGERLVGISNVAGAVLVASAGLAAGIGANKVQASPCGADSSGRAAHTPVACGWIDFGRYRPKNIRRLDKVPPSINAAVTGHLRQRAGSLYSHLHFRGGQAIDEAAFRDVEPDLAKRWGALPAYVLLFALDGLKGYDGRLTCIEVDSSGEPVEEASLPDVVNNPEKAVVISRDEAIKMAKKNGVPIRRANIELAYFRDVDSLEWLFSYAADPAADGGRGITCHIPAHDPVAVHWSEYTFVY